MERVAFAMDNLNRLVNILNQVDDGAIDEKADSIACKIGLNTTIKELIEMCLKAEALICLDFPDQIQERLMVWCVAGNENCDAIKKAVESLSLDKVTRDLTKGGNNNAQNEG
jgi:hypothetical protein